MPRVIRLTVFAVVMTALAGSAVLWSYLFMLRNASGDACVWVLGVGGC